MNIFQKIKRETNLYQDSFENNSYCNDPSKQLVDWSKIKEQALDITNTNICPVCKSYNETIEKRKNTISHDVCFCWHCGQKLKW